MNTLFIATVGIGRFDEDIVSPLIKSITEANPTFLLLFASKSSKPKGEKVLTQLCRTENNSLIHTLAADEWDVEALFKEMCDVITAVINRHRIKPDDVTADFTTGTKPMSAALACAALRLGLGRLKYIKVRRDEKSQAIPGSERTITFEPRGFQATFMLKTAIDLMRCYRFDSALQILATLSEDLLNESEKTLKKALTALAHAYSGWDLFGHKKFVSNYRQSDVEKLPELADFVVSDETVNLIDEIARCGENEIKDIMIIDLLNNAIRRITEGKYDDAVARLYRTCEMIAQWRLLQQGITTSNVDLNKVPPKSKCWLANYRTCDGRIKIGLAKSYQLLAEMGDELGKKYTDGRELQAILNERNNSILAHGFKPISQPTAEGLLARICAIAKTVISDFDRKRRLLQFPWGFSSSRC